MNKVQKIIVSESQALNCELRVLITTTNDNQEYLNLIKLSKRFEYQFKVENHFKIQIEIKIWTATIVSTSFIFASTTNIMIALHHSRIDNKWSTLELKSTLDLWFMLKKTNHERIQEYCFKDSLIIVQVNAVKSDTTFKIQLAAIKKLNFAHINKKKLIHNFKWRNILIDQDLRTKKEINIFKDDDIKAKLNAWDISFNEEQMKTLQYCCTLLNNFNLIKDVFELSKMFMNVVITLLLISIDQKVKVLSLFNHAADAFIIKLHKQLEAFCQKRLDIMNQHCVRCHTFSTKHKVLAYENLKHTTQKSHLDQMHWTEITLLLNMIYDFMTHHLIEKSRILPHEIHDHRYQVHNVSMLTLLIRLCEFNKRQSSSFENSNDQSISVKIIKNDDFKIDVFKIDDFKTIALENDDSSKNNNFKISNFSDDDLKNDDFKKNNFKKNNFKFNDLKNDDFKNDDLKKNNFKFSDLKSDDFKNDDFKSDDFKSDNLKNDNLKKNNFKKNNFKISDVKNDDFKINDVKNDDFKNDDFKSDDLKKNNFKISNLKNDDLKSDDLKNDDFKKNNFKISDVKSDDFKNDDAKNDDFKSDDAKNDDFKSDDAKNDDFKIKKLNTIKFKNNDLKSNEFNSSDKIDLKNDFEKIEDDHDTTTFRLIWVKDKAKNKMKQKFLSHCTQLKLNKQLNEIDHQAYIWNFTQFWIRVKIKEQLNSQDRAWMSLYEQKLHKNILKTNVCMMICMTTISDDLLIQEFKVNHVILQKIIRLQNVEIFVDMT